MRYKVYIINTTNSKTIHAGYLVDSTKSIHNTIYTWWFYPELKLSSTGVELSKWTGTLGTCKTGVEYTNISFSTKKAFNKWFTEKYFVWLI
jgi:hypothetical protein